jgi:superfamily II DNA helicase RecQ
MATPRMIKDAAEQCKDAGIAVSADLLNIKVEEEEESDAEDAPAPIAPKAAKESSKSTSKTGRSEITIGMAEYLVTEGCLVEVLDREFNNPPHVPCYEIEGCYNCKRKRRTEEAAQVPKQEENELEVQEYNPQAKELKQQTTESAKETTRSAKETKIFKKAIQDCSGRAQHMRGCIYD